MCFKRSLKVPTSWQKAREEKEEFQQAQVIKNKVFEKGNQLIRLKSVRWQKPKMTWYKVNWDEALYGNRSNMSGGIVVRNWESDLMVDVCMPKLFIDNPLQAELLALERVIELCT